VYISIYEIENRKGKQVDKRHNFTSIQKAKAKAKANRKEIHTDRLHNLFRLLMYGEVFFFSFSFFPFWMVFPWSKKP
jgi:hypothetical protein